MARPRLSPEKLKCYLSLISSEQAVGASGLAILFAASTLALVPSASAIALVEWISGLGLNVLAGVLQQRYQTLLSQPTEDELGRLETLARSLTRDIRRKAELRHEIGAFLGSLDAFQIAKEVVEGNPAVHGWFLVKIFDEVHQYEVHFERIHTTLAEMKDLIESLSLGKVTSSDVEQLEMTTLQEARVLVIEDVRSHQLAVAQVLDDLGLAYVTASDLDIALTLIRSRKFELIILDMQLDLMDRKGQAGFLLLDQMRTYQREVPVIIISGLDWTAADVRDFFVYHKTFDFFPKPFNPSELKNRIQNVFAEEGE